ncbi:MAG: hypothetical protein AABX33_06055 [Nanoarchaeota archaeon]
MALTDIVSGEFQRVKNFLFTPKEKGAMLQYLTQYDLKDQFTRAPEDQRRKLYERLEHHLDQTILKYSSYLNSWTQKAAGIGGIATGVMDAYAMFGSKYTLPAAMYWPLHAAMVIGKTVVEAPSFLYYAFKEGDYLGILKWLGMKPFELAIPIFGPLMGAGWTEKIVRQRIMYEAKDNFLKELGILAEAPYKRLDRHAEAKTGYQIAPQYA